MRIAQHGTGLLQIEIIVNKDNFLKIGREIRKHQHAFMDFNAPRDSYGAGTDQETGRIYVNVPQDIPNLIQLINYMLLFDTDRKVD